MKFIKIYLFLLLLIYIVNSIEIDSHSLLKAYDKGGNVFVVVGRDFPSLPTLSIQIGSGTPVAFAYVGKLGDEYRWTVPPAPLDIASKKRKFTSSQVVFSISFDTTAPPYFTGTFEYIEPVINVLNPSSYYPVSNGAKQLKITGAFFIINDYDTLPVVRLIRGDGAFQNLAISLARGNELQCALPNIDPTNIGPYVIKVIVYTGLEVTAPSTFDFVLPVVKLIKPDHGISGVSHTITISGDNLYLYRKTKPSDADLPVYKITVDAKPCTNVEVDKTTGDITCQTASKDLAPSVVEQHDIDIVIDQQQAFCDKKFILYTPEILTITPKRGFADGGTDVTVQGKYLMDVTAASIGGVACVIDITTKLADSFVCKTGAFDLSDISGPTFSLIAQIGGASYSSPTTEMFTYYKPTIDSISPTAIIDKAKWIVKIKGSGFYQNNKVKIADQVYDPAIVSTDKTLYVEVDSSKHTVGDADLIVNSDGGDSNTVKLAIVKPEITAVAPTTGYLHSETKVTLTIKNFPLGLAKEDVESVIQVKIKDKSCDLLQQVDATTMTCVVPPGDAAQPEDITFSIKKVDYTSTVKFNYFEPAVTAQSQSTNIPKGGGNLIIDGTNLDSISSVNIDGVAIDKAKCTITTVQIKCQIPAHVPGAFAVKMILIDSNIIEHEYDTGTNINFVGPSVTKVSPKQGSKKRATTITLEGTGFGNTPALITATVGTQACSNIAVLTNDKKITCDIPAMDADVYPVVAKVKPTLTGTAVDSMNDVTFTSNTLRCLAPADADKSNKAVDWWFTYKLSKGPGNPYLYIDSTMDKLERKTGLQDHGTGLFSSVEATFSQYSDYYYLFFNDQPDTRASGNRGKAGFKASEGAHGHLKGMIFWDDPDPTTHVVSGIHIEHSNPAFPSYTSSAGTNYNGPSAGINFLGAADYNQYFYCYSFNNLDEAARYISFNDGNLLKKKNLFAGMNTWTQPQKNDYPYLYDYLTQHLKYPARVPSAGKPAFKKPSDLMSDCEATIATTTALENVCWWRTGQIQIANGNLNAYYFMKIGTSFTKKNYPFGNAKHARPPTLSKYIMAKQGTKVYDGIDTWMVVADHFQRKMFSEMFYAIASKQMAPTEYVLNVGYLELPQTLAHQTINGGGGTDYEHYQFTGRSNEHAKLGFPMYPAYGDDALAANENYFCVGDSNRHNGQGGRGGGVICFQHPTLVFQYNRMVRHYNTFNAAGQITSPSDRDTIELFFAVNQPIKLTRPATWANPISIEVKDSIDNKHISKLPKEVYSVLAATIADPHDVIATFQALRTTKTHTAPTGGESTSVIGVATLPASQVDIMGFVADDILTVHYQAYDELIGSVCDYEATQTTCTKAESRATEITFTTPTGYVQPDYPESYGYTYAGLQAVRRYNLNVNNDFILLKFVSEFAKKLTNPKKKTYEFMVDTNNNILTSRFTPPLIMRRTEDMCEEEIAYFMTLQYIYYQGGSRPHGELLYNIDADSPNWANGIILAISKKLYNSMKVGKDAKFDTCMDEIFDNYPNIDTYLDDKSMVDPISADKIVRRTASAAWDWMSDSYSDGNGGPNVKRVDNSDVIPVIYLLNFMIRTFQSSGATSLDTLGALLPKKFRTENNLQTILVNRYIIKPPAPKAKVDGDGDLILMRIPTGLNFLSRMLMEEDGEVSVNQTPLLSSEISTESGIHQLLQTYMLTMNESSLTSLTPYEQDKLELSIDKWVTILGQSQAIQVLVLNPMTQTSNQPIKFIDEINRDQNGYRIDLGYESIGTTGTRYTLLSPLSIVSITFVVFESILVNEETVSTQFGDFELYYLPKPAGYNGSISSSLNGMLISTINSQLCDIIMISQSDFAANNFDSICTGIGPIITSVDSLSGSTSGGNQITLTGIRFNSSMIISIGDKQCQTTTLLSSTQLVCQVPKGTGTKHLIQLSTDQTLFNLQRTKFLYSYQAPNIESISPDIVESFGSDLLTITGSNFGDDVTKATVMIDENLECSPILSITSNLIACLTPSAIGDHRSITVKVDGQSSTLTIQTLGTQTFSFSGPQINAFAPSSGDPTDMIVILGNGFGNVEDSDLPPLLLIDGNLVEITNFTNEEITFSLEYDTLTQPLEIQVGDQKVDTNFSYLPPVVSLLNDTSVLTTGGLIQFYGYGWGISTESEIDFKLSSEEIECNSFDYFVECYIPPGIGGNLTITMSAPAGQLPNIQFNATISYIPPQITNFNFNITEKSLQIFGQNFVPIELGVGFDTSSTYVNLGYDDHVLKCTTFKSSIEVDCIYDTILPKTAQVVVGGQSSNIINFETF